MKTCMGGEIHKNRALRRVFEPEKAVTGIRRNLNELVIFSLTKSSQDDQIDGGGGKR